MFCVLTAINIVILTFHLIVKPYSSVWSNSNETILLTIHALITALMTTLPFPLKHGQDTGMALLVFLPATLFVISIISVRIISCYRSKADPKDGSVVPLWSSTSARKRAPHTSHMNADLRRPLTLNDGVNHQSDFNDDDDL